jgi:hypothetical protein
LAFTEAAAAEEAVATFVTAEDACVMNEAARSEELVCVMNEGVRMEAGVPEVLRWAPPPPPEVAAPIELLRAAGVAAAVAVAVVAGRAAGLALDGA